MKTKLSVYQLKCGYVQVEEVFLTCYHWVKLELYNEHNCYHVRAFNSVKGSSISNKLAWDCFDSVKDARKRFIELSNLYRSK